jgi:hypothetical protein
MMPELYLADALGATGKPTPVDAKPLTAKSYLIVTIPLYMRWDQPEIAQ